MLVWAFYAAPDQRFEIHSGWLAAACALAAIAALLQLLITWYFVSWYGGTRETASVCRFVGLKGLMNLWLPASAGTVLLLPRFCRDTGLSWRDYVIFLGVLAVAMTGATLSVMLAGFEHWWAALVVLAAGLVLPMLMANGRRWALPRSARNGVPVLASASAIANLFVAFCLIRALTPEIQLDDTLLVAASIGLTNLANITPGNLGIRELVVAAIAQVQVLPTLNLVVVALITNVLRAAGFFLLILYAQAVSDKPT